MALAMWMTIRALGTSFFLQSYGPLLCRRLIPQATPVTDPELRDSMSLHDAHREPIRTLGGTFGAHVILRRGRCWGFVCLFGRPPLEFCHMD